MLWLSVLVCLLCDWFFGVDWCVRMLVPRLAVLGFGCAWFGFTLCCWRVCLHICGGWLVGGWCFGGGLGVLFHWVWFVWFWVRAFLVGCSRVLPLGFCL